jgi:transglutaminase-like putative cysteine protease
LHKFTIAHQTTYRYQERVHESYTVVHLQPRSDPSQYCTRYDLQVTPSTRVFSYSDRFGNEVQHFAVLPDHDHLSIVARSAITTVRPAEPARPAPTTRAALRADPAAVWLLDERAESVYIAFGPALRGFAGEIGDPGDDDLVAWLLHAGETIAAGFTYDKTATGVMTAVDEAIRLRRGVCQDYAHVLIALARFYGIPARYVSGYLFSDQADEVVGAEASHAWCDLYLPPHGWVGYDPTNHTLIDDRFAVVAVGRDYRDVSPVRGVYKGGSRSTMSVNVEMEALAGAQQ